jgi:hypothetical protein
MDPAALVFHTAVVLRHQPAILKSLLDTLPPNVATTTFDKDGEVEVIFVQTLSDARIYSVSASDQNVQPFTMADLRSKMYGNDDDSQFKLLLSSLGHCLPCLATMLQMVCPSIDWNFLRSAKHAHEGK